jgi:hypothetical protein
MQENSGKMYNLVSQSIRADGYFGMTDGMHTVQASFTNFTGGFGLQGTLSLNPSDKDWFWIELKQILDFNTAPFIKFPLNPLAPTGSAGNGTTYVGDSVNLAWTFIGNFTFIRSVVIRDYLGLTSPDTFILGPGNIINSAKLTSKNSILYTPQTSSMLVSQNNFGSVDRVLVCL